MKTNKTHWEDVYEIKLPHEVSWTQDIPSTSLEMIERANLPKNARIIDIGGGDSKLVDYLLREGYEDISVLDISEKALARAQKRLGHLAENITWIAADVTEFQPQVSYDLWHDRATFHFLTTQPQINRYLSIASQAVKNYLVVATFSESGPIKCSGLEIKQYSEIQLESEFNKNFEKIICKTEDHLTPFQTKQNFTFCSFHKRGDALTA